MVHIANSFFHSYLLAIFLAFAVIQGECLEFTYPSFPEETRSNFSFPGSSNLAVDALQVTYDVSGSPITNLSGRILNNEPLKLWSKSKNKTASFNSTFTIRISPKNSSGGEGLAFILAADYGIPENSYGQWLGIVNASTNGSASNNIVAVEFDTRKSYSDDLDSNHVGIDINSIYSVYQVSLNSYGFVIANDTDLPVRIQYDGVSTNLSLSVILTNKEILIFSYPLDLSWHLPETVFVGFSASTGVATELNCIRSWNFTSTDINDSSKNMMWLYILLSGILVMLISCLVGIYVWRKWMRNRNQVQVDDPRMIEQKIQSSTMAPKKFRLKELKSATKNFNAKRKLGKGGFGTVYKGILNNMEVAVKRVSENSRHNQQDFIAEVVTISNLHHKNLVKLIGWCYESNELLLVYEFMPNSSLEKFIFCEENASREQCALGWDTRHRVICGVAQALDYLHFGCEKRVLHRDIKASNIMLDSEFNARLGDFGLARMIQPSKQTHHTTKELAGTPGYMAPEYFHTGHATAEADVYAFGVLVLEVACGRKPGFQSEINKFNNGIVDWVWELYKLGRTTDAVDFQLDGEFDEEQAESALLLALACCHPNPYQRPTMRNALQVLTGEAPPPFVPVDRPAFMWPATGPSIRIELDYTLHDDGEITPITDLSGR
ncbi:Protein kinase domain [Dillenia turbinata]|uniref:non-specific serine/threonine protein kinase n=1 Tax=Dillenia turbinata TaxID=194707 RepID=A0AAN8W565_9MAGN